MRRRLFAAALLAAGLACAAPAAAAGCDGTRHRYRKERRKEGGDAQDCWNQQVRHEKQVRHEE
jgi:hypothetical protein